MNKVIQLIIKEQNPQEHFRQEGLNIYIGKTPEHLLQLEEFHSCLSTEEKARADKFKFPELKDTYVACHGKLRHLLSEKTGEEAGKIQIDTGKFGKPELAEHPLHFNISHSKDVFAIAISEETEIGIDVEVINPDFTYSGIIQSWFHPNEIKAIEAETERTSQLQKFYTFWTRKEAFLKAIGIGLINELQSIDTSCSNRNTPCDSLKAMFSGKKESKVAIQNWSVEDAVVSYAQFGEK